MIIYGHSLQARSEEVPKEVAEWIVERNAILPDVRFTIEIASMPFEQLDAYTKTAEKYSQTFIAVRRGTKSAECQICFLYKTEYWRIHIVGKFEEAQIFSPPKNIEHFEGILAVPREETDLLDDAEMVPLKGDEFLTSEITLQR